MYLFNKPISMPRGKKYGSDYWVVYSSKLKRQVILYSLLEYYYFLILEMSSDVEYFCEQPLKIEIEIDGTKHNSVFDFWVYYKDKHTELQEVKYAKELSGNTPEALRSQNQIKHQQQWCLENGFTHKVITDKDILNNDFLIENLKILQHRVSRYEIIDYEFYCEKLREFIINHGGKVTIDEIIKADILLSDNELSFIGLAYQKGDIVLDLNNRPIDYSMEVKV